MSRISWMEDGDLDDEFAILSWGRWIARTNKVRKGKPAYDALKEFEQILLNMQHKQLIEGALCDGTGVCAMGAWVYQKYRDDGLTPKQAWKQLKKASGRSGEDSYTTWLATVETGETQLGITKTLAEMVSTRNDEFWHKSPEGRYHDVLMWVQQTIRNSPHAKSSLPLQP